MTRYWIAPLLAAPLVALGIWLWRDQGLMIALADFAAACF